MFLLLLYNQLLYDACEYWWNGSKGEFVNVSLEAMKYLTPYIAESASKRLVKREPEDFPDKSYYEAIFWQDWGVVKELPEEGWVRWPMQLYIYGNDRSWEPGFVPPYCLLKEEYAHLKTKAKPEEIDLDKYECFWPMRTYEGQSLEEAMKHWEELDRVWLENIFDYIKKRNSHILKNKESGKAIVQWCKENNYSNPIFAMNEFWGYHYKAQKFVQMADDKFLFIVTQVSTSWEPWQKELRYRIHSHQVPEASIDFRNSTKHLTNEQKTSFDG